MTERTVFLAVLEYDDLAERSAYLDRACAGEPVLRARVEKLLTAHDQAGSFMGRPAPERLAANHPSRPETDDTQTSPSTSESDERIDFLEPSENPGSIGRLGHYEVQEVVGRGGMGVVLKAFDERLHRVVAIKVMATQLAASATARKRFIREARAAAAVTHDHVVTIHAVEDAGPLPYIVMQFVAGNSLQDRLDRSGPLPLTEILRIGMQTASGLAAAHAQGLVHRDVKPANILLENGVERVKLTDFGLARAADDASLTQSGTVAGTPSFMSPEQAEGNAVNYRSDLFSLGSVLYAMCTGRPPFRAGTSMGVLKRVCEETPAPIRETNPEIPDWLVAVVVKLHAKDPAARFQSATEVAELLGQHLAHVQHPSVVPLPAVAKSVEHPHGPERPARWNRWAVAAAVLAAMLAILGTGEATGVTNVRASVIRILTPEGTLVVETDDPAVKVTVEGDGDLVITGAGPQEVRLRAGSYRLHAVKDGKPVKLDRDLVTITRGDRAIVRVRMEGDAPAAVLPTVERGAFVLQGGKGVPERKFDTLTEAVQSATDGDTIEVRGNGPFVSDPVMISNRRALTIRAGTGVRPVLRLSRGTVEDQPFLFKTNGPLVLEGLEIRCERRPTVNTAVVFAAVVAIESRVHVANCRFVTPFRQALNIPDCRRAVVTNCEFLGGPTEFSALAGNPASGGAWEVNNCVQIGGAAVSCGKVSGDVRERTVQIRQCSLVGCPPVLFYFYATPKDLESGQAARTVRVEVSGCLLDVGQLTSAIWYAEAMNQSHTPPAVKPEDAFRRMIGWRGSDNAYHRLGNGPSGPEGALIHLQAGKQDEWLPAVKDLETWRNFWGSPETGSVAGEVRYRGGDLAARWPKEAEKLTPEDFRLRLDSAGYRAGKDGKDLGANVDLVGPGAAYERWKKTPEYQQWLKESGQSRAPAPPPDRNAFVLQAAGAERKFNTLAEAVQRASDGDTIEVRGNGPFVSQPIHIQRYALTIRAGEGFRPVIKLIPEALQQDVALLFSNAALVLEGLELHRAPPEDPSIRVRAAVLIDHAPLLAANCRFRAPVQSSHSPVCSLRNCEFLSVRTAAAYWGNHGPGARVSFENCVHRGGFRQPGIGLSYDDPAELRDITFQIERSTFLNSIPLWIPPRGPLTGASQPMCLRVTQCIFDCPRTLGLVTRKADMLEPAEAEATLLRRLQWQGERNLFDGGSTSVLWKADSQEQPPHGPKDLEEWKRFWGGAETDSQEGTPQFQGGNLRARSDDSIDQLTPEDFRLRAGSPGSKAGKDGKDLGADVDLVGPGAAYERWKKTPEYQQWLKETGKFKK